MEIPTGLHVLEHSYLTCPSNARLPPFHGTRCFQDAWVEKRGETPITPAEKHFPESFEKDAARSLGAYFLIRHGLLPTTVHKSICANNKMMVPSSEAIVPDGPTQSTLHTSKKGISGLTNGCIGTRSLNRTHNGYLTPQSGVADFQVENLLNSGLPHVPQTPSIIWIVLSTIDALSLDDICSYHGYLGTCR
ncbi:hypothetical protein TNCV_3171721 [Trichonephila clavipes]|nr:hypothetical protein TNCV_3171721 [Trichonephila clavipes]